MCKKIKFNFLIIPIAAVFTTILLIFGNAAAVTITVTDATPTYTATKPTCKAGTYVDCKSTAHLNTSSLSGTDAEFKKSFDAWNATNAAGSKWTLANGGALPGGALNVSTFDAIALDSVGGLEIQVDWTYSGADKGDYKWSQGLYDNYLLDGSIVTPFYEMDVIAAGCDNTILLKQCPPLYPYQYGDRHFYDKPMAPWPNSFFEARAFISKADFTARKLTIYEGVNYGFRLSVPESDTLVLLIFGFLGLTLIGIRVRRYS
ncbi:MAG: hypothetical protein HZA08_02910 [Nitrospirae bacterium]|nr:hypothetical protein [Nitrospirota bacterium]